MRTSGAIMNTSISAYAVSRRARCHRPGEGRGRSQRRVPSGLSVGSTRSGDWIGPSVDVMS
jgi:hypothetical protein